MQHPQNSVRWRKSWHPVRIRLVFPSPSRRYAPPVCAQAPYHRPPRGVTTKPRDGAWTANIPPKGNDRSRIPDGAPLWNTRLFRKGGLLRPPWDFRAVPGGRAIVFPLSAVKNPQNCGCYEFLSSRKREYNHVLFFISRGASLTSPQSTSHQRRWCGSGATYTTSSGVFS